MGTIKQTNKQQDQYQMKKNEEAILTGRTSEKIVKSKARHNIL
jgi:hypothetical protein